MEKQLCKLNCSHGKVSHALKEKESFIRECIERRKRIGRIERGLEYWNEIEGRQVKKMIHEIVKNC